MVKLIGIHGKARSGKDTVANYLVEKYEYERFAFADPMKMGMMEMLGWTWEHVYGVRKEEVDPMYGVSPRHALQTLGTDWGREMINKDIWIIAGLQKIKRMELCVIADIRFDNEADMVREAGGIIIHLNRDDAPEVRAHASEAGIMMKPEDWFIDNSSTLEDLYESIEVILDNA